MKKILTILAILMVAVVGRTYADDDVEWTEVGTADLFLSTINNNHAANVKLTADIDLSGKSFSTEPIFNFTFTGKINGEKPDGGTYHIKGNSNSYGSMLFIKASGATFEHLYFEQFYWQEVVGEEQAVITAESANSTYNDITLSGCEINSNDHSLIEYGGLIGISNSDRLTLCTVDKTCYLYGYSSSDSNAGGLVGKAYSTTFTQCWNAAQVSANNNQVGGIVAYASGCTFDRCLNSGVINGEDNVGGIVGNALNCVIKRCVNTGNIDTWSFFDEDKRAGIVGYLHGSGSSITQCLNFGNVYDCDDDCGALEGCAKDGATGAYNTHSYYYCTCNHKEKQNNENEYTEENSIYRIAKMKSGEFAYKSTVDEAGTEKWLYQSIDNNNGFPTTYPVPIPDAGTVYRNVLCNGAETFTNVSTYQSSEAHTGEADTNGYCIRCGSYIGTSELHVKSAAYLCEFAKAVNNGTDYSGSIVYLDDDIDMTDADFEPIGSKEYPFHGTFDGQGHRIKNLTINNTDDAYTGFFGYVGGYNAVTTTTIKNVIIDSSCSITSTATGVAGLIGGVTSTSNILCTVTIQNCGNEAPVTGNKNVAGILGGMYGNNNTKLYIINSFNTGTITGGSESAAICGYARDSYYIVNCYNSGTVTGNEANKSFFRYSSSSSYYFRTTSNCYDVNADQTGVTKITSDQVRLGSLCNILNTNHGDYSAWTQDLENNTHPVFGTTAAVTYTRSTENQWGTIVLPFDVTVSESDTYAFYNITSIANNTITLTQRVNTLTAGTPALIHMKDEAKNATTGLYDLSLTAGGDITQAITNPSAVEGLTLTGTFSSTDITSTNGYKLDKNCFKNISTLTSESVTTVSCEPFRAYLAGTLTGNPDQIKLDGEATAINITNAQGLMAFASAVNSGAYDSDDKVILANDIDVSSETGFVPIGTTTHPFNGTFDGKGHRINLCFLYPEVETGIGLFGVVTGKNTVIKNVITSGVISSNKNTAKGIAGVVGYVNSGESACNVTIQNCGNEVKIVATSREYVAGIIGGVNADDYTHITIENCYNNAAISCGSDDNYTAINASVCGYAGNNFTIANCYNNGTVSYSTDGSYLYRYNTSSSSSNQSVSNCFDTNCSQTGVTSITASQVTYGELCHMLNSQEIYEDLFTQDLESDTYPVPSPCAGSDRSNSGLYYARSMTNQWGTICLPFDIKYNEENTFDIYTITSVSGSTITLEKKTTTLEKGTPALIRMSEASKNATTGKYELNMNTTEQPGVTITNPAAVDGLTLTGTYTQADITSLDGYIIANNSFWKISTLASSSTSPKVYCNPFRAYLAGTIASGAKELTIGFGDETPTAVEALNAISAGTAEYYNLNGRKLSDLQKGVNIVRFSNGVTKKIIIK